MTKKVKQQKQSLVKRVSPENLEKWGGVFNSQDLKREGAEMCLKIAQIYNVPPSGVNLMAGQPYLNKEARLILLHRYRKVKKMLTMVLQTSKSSEEIAMCKQVIVFEDDRYVDAIGEAGIGNVKLTAVKSTLNMMAETRALNRAIWKDIAGDVWNDAIKNFEKMDLSEDEKEAVMEAGRVSAEELNYDEVAGNVSEKTFKKSMNILEETKHEMTDERKKEVAEKIQKSDVYTKEQKKKLTDFLYEE